MTTRYYFASLRHTNQGIAQGCINEIEDTLLSCSEGAYLSGDNLPDSNQVGNKFLFVTAMTIHQVCQILDSIDNWRTRFDKVCAYVTDSFISESDYNKSPWRKRFSKSMKTIGMLDYIFISTGSNVAEFQEFYNIPAMFIPIACDVVKFGSSNSNRFIDINGYGRQDPEISALLADIYNKPGTPDIYYHTDHMQTMSVKNHQQQRYLFWKILQQSKILLAYDPVKADTSNRFKFSFVALRWMEGITAGCLVVGKRPDCKEAEELLFWEDSTIELPDEINAIPGSIRTLLEDTQHVEAIRNRNYLHALKYHDWRYRFADIHSALGLEYPQALVNELAAIKESAQSIENAS